MSELEQRRKRARVSRDRAAVAAGVSYPTARAFELGGPDAVKDPEKRAALVRVYEGFKPRRKQSRRRVLLKGESRSVRSGFVWHQHE